MLRRRIQAAPPRRRIHERDDGIGQMHRCQRRKKAERRRPQPGDAQRHQRHRHRRLRHAVRQKTPSATPGPGSAGEERRGQDANRRTPKRRHRLFNRQERHEAHNHAGNGDLRHHYCANQTDASRTRRRRAGPNESQVRRVP